MVFKIIARTFVFGIGNKISTDELQLAETKLQEALELADASMANIVDSDVSSNFATLTACLC